MNGDEISKVWPDWKVVRTLGHGNSGSVYEVERNWPGTGPKAAVKVLKIPGNRSVIEKMRNDGFDDGSIARRMDGELEEILKKYSLLTEMKKSSNIVNCSDVKYVKHEDGPGYDVFIRMELLTPLSRIVGKGLDARTAGALALKVGKDICHALEQCEKENFVHLDIKPQNILLSEFGDYKLGDFSNVQAMEQISGDIAPDAYKYAAPEVYNARPYGPGADLYSLGLVLYWLLNEKHLPFAPFLPLLTAVPAASVEKEALEKRLNWVPVQDPRNGSKALKAVVRKACAYRPEDRFASAGELLHALELAEASGEQTQGTGSIQETASIQGVGSIPEAVSVQGVGSIPEVVSVQGVGSIPETVSVQGVGSIPEAGGTSGTGSIPKSIDIPGSGSIPKPADIPGSSNVPKSAGTFTPKAAGSLEVDKDKKRPGRRQNSGSDAKASKYPMKWYKFIIYVQLFFNAFSNLMSASTYFNGTQYEPNTDAVYNRFPGLRTLDIFMGILCIALSIFCIVVRQELAHFRKRGPDWYLILLGTAVLVPLLYLIAGIQITGISIMDASLMQTIGINVVLIVANRIYFNKRKELFVN